MEEQSSEQQGHCREEGEGTGEGSSWVWLHRQKLANILLVVLSLACLLLAVLMFAAAVGYFSMIFSHADEQTADRELRRNYSSILACIYMFGVGLTIVTVNTGLNFTSFTFKEGILALHIVYFIAMLALGVSAMVSFSSLSAQLSSQYASSQECSDQDFRCLCYPAFMTLHRQFQAYLPGFLVSFVAFSAVFQLRAYWERRDREKMGVISLAPEEDGHTRTKKVKKAQQERKDKDEISAISI